MTYELLIKGGTLIDPAQGIHAPKDVAFAGGTVADAGVDLPRENAQQVLDASGHILAPGMVDLHVHVYAGVSHYGIEPDSTSLARGATTVVDAGSAGADTFPGLRNYVIEASDTRIFAYLNISSQGMVTREIGELRLLEYANVDKACEMIQQHRDVILGVKVRLTRDTIVSQDAGLQPLYRAREASDAFGMPIMVHPQGAWSSSIDDILAVMREGDVLTHCFHGLAGGILDEQGTVRDSVHSAIERGVHFDVGHGQASFSWGIVEKAMAQGIEPETISSDLHIYNVNGPVYDLATVVNKFLYLGLPLDTAIAKVTAVPARVLGMSDRLGTLGIGAWGDATIFEMEHGQFHLEDSYGQVRSASQRLVPVAVVKGGRLHVAP